jgi:hypothetical protein
LEIAACLGVLQVNHLVFLATLMIKFEAVIL